MPALNKFNTFALALAQKKHNLGTDALTVALTDVAPVATNAVLADITQISYTNLGTRVITQVSLAQTSGLAKLLLTDKTLTATGNVAQFRYAVIYNDTASNDELVGWLDLGGEFLMTNGSNLILDFDGTNGAITIQ